MFVGTVNIDESTYHFSDKVLDRANVIELNVLPFGNLIEKTSEEKTKGVQDVALNYSTFMNFKKIERRCELTADEIALLTEVHNMLNRANKNLGIGFRIVKQIDSYLKNLPYISQPYEDIKVMNRGEAFDCIFYGQFALTV